MNSTRPQLPRSVFPALALALFAASPVAPRAAEAPRAEAPKLLTLASDPRLSLKLGPSSVVMGDGGYQPFLFCTAQGTLLCQAQLDEPPFHSKHKPVYHVRIGTAISRDRGLTWQPWAQVANRDPVFIEGGAVQRSDGTILLLDTFVIPGAKKNQAIGELWKSSDDLQSLHGPFDVPFHLPGLAFGSSTNDMGVKIQVARVHRSLIEMPNGDLLTLIYHPFEGDNAPASYMPTMMKSRVVVVRSRDHGDTWDYLATVGVDSGVGTEGYGEPVLVRVARGPHAGRLLCLSRTGRELHGSHSDDEGKTWVHPTPVRFPGVDIYDTAQWEGLFVDRKDPDTIPSNEMIGALVDPELIQMQNGVLVCAFGARMPARKANEGYGRSFIKTADGKTPDLRPIPGKRYDTWRTPRNGDYLAFSFDGGDTWSGVVQFRSALPTTHYIGIREVAPDLLYVVYDNSLMKERQPADVVHQALGFQLAVRRTDGLSAAP